MSRDTGVPAVDGLIEAWEDPEFADSEIEHEINKQRASDLQEVFSTVDDELSSIRFILFSTGLAMSTLGIGMTLPGYSWAIYFGLVVMVGTVYQKWQDRLHQ